METPNYDVGFAVKRMCQIWQEMTIKVKEIPFKPSSRFNENFNRPPNLRFDFSTVSFICIYVYKT